MKWIKRIFANLLFLTVSFSVGLVLSEIGVRLFLNPADYLSATMIKDPVLGHKIAAGGAGFDEWGFRNRNVPSHADLVTVGDSHTYGNNVRMTDSWPYVAGASAEASVDNLGMGGYGPNDYYYLLEKYLPQLRPHWVICGLYLGDDFENAYVTTYGRDYWAFLRKGEWGKADANVLEPPDESTALGRLTNWLSRRSILYRLTVHGPLFGGFKGHLQIRKAAQDDTGARTSLLVPESQIEEAFVPFSVAGNLDQSRPQIREGVRLTLELLNLMKFVSHRNGAAFAVLIIPTKEMVFGDYLLRNPETKLKEVIKKVTDDERKATDEVKDFLSKSGIPYVDVLSDLRKNVGDHLYTASDKDMHPGKNGHRILGQAVATFLRTHNSDN